MTTKLLLIGDERKNRRMCAWGFAAEPYRVRLANSRASVEALIDAEPFHAACLDWRMREDDAAGIVEMLQDRLPELPVVAMVGGNERSGKPVARARGVSAVLVS